MITESFVNHDNICQLIHIFVRCQSKKTVSIFVNKTFVMQLVDREKNILNKIMYRRRQDIFDRGIDRNN